MYVGEFSIKSTCGYVNQIDLWSSWAEPIASLRFHLFFSIRIICQLLPAKSGYK